MRLTEVVVELGARAYRVRIGPRLLDRAGEQLAPLVRRGRLIVVTDEQVWAAQGERLVAGLRPIEAIPLTVPVGEVAKSWPILADLTERLLGAGIERGEPVVAFGGGVVGDLAGFAAAICKRGLPWVQIPTSLLAQVDSSVGGKTGINAGAGKNMVGAFHQPAMVLIDPDCLHTLDPRQLRAGYAEIVKYALIENSAFFDWLEANGAAVLARDPAALGHALGASVAGKARIVAEDEREIFGRRALLNLGHTFAHALEAEAGFSDTLLHGEAVSIGLVLAFDLSARLALCGEAEATRIRNHLSGLGLPVSLAEAGRPDPERILERMRTDKKSAGGRITFVLARGIGRAVLADDVEAEDVLDLLGSS